MTYPERSVYETINERFVPVQVDTHDESSKSVIECYRQFWTPDLRVLDPDGNDLYRWNGYLPPYEFLPQLLAAQAQAYLRLGNPGAAAGIYDDVLKRFPTAAIAPEAQYFLAVSKYKESGASPDLLDNWKRLQTRYPYSIWRIKQSFTDRP